MPPSKITYIEDLPELDDIFDKQQSMQGYPPRINPDFSKQMNDEMSERDRTMRPLQGKIRQSTDFRAAVAGGMPGIPGMNGGMQGMQGMSGMPSPGLMSMNGMMPGMAGMAGMIVPHHPPRHPPQPQHRQSHDIDEEEDEYQMGPRIQQHRQKHMSQDISCIEIAKHIKSCPICSKFYDTDKSLYIIVIIILLMFCILLLKKILFVKE